MLDLKLACALVGLLASVAAQDTCPPKNSRCSISPASDTGPLACGTLGFLTKEAVLSTCDSSSFQGCRDSCMGNGFCRSFSYAAGNSTCKRYKRPIAGQGYMDRTVDHGAVFYSRFCFSSAESRGPQLVANPSFEALVPGSSAVVAQNWTTNLDGKYGLRDMSSIGWERGTSPDGSKIRGIFRSDSSMLSRAGQISQEMTAGTSACPDSVQNATITLDVGKTASNNGSMVLIVFLDEHELDSADMPNGSGKYGRFSICEDGPACKLVAGAGEPSIVWQSLTFIGTRFASDNVMNNNPGVTVFFMPQTAQDVRKPWYVDNVKLFLGT